MNLFQAIDTGTTLIYLPAQLATSLYDMVSPVLSSKRSVYAQSLPRFLVAAKRLKSGQVGTVYRADSAP